ncbi:YeeE/YedE family protein [Vibrio sp. LaRot3]|uniref:YeeE/YedE family protein n=1 Tax=Vibrio sp. LaRot3 TaxID=2998829 RepID=UPI0022CE2295|nr:YeeE/YedE thiosulfate transporter family protein [Vibrio sp. LaRot3]MDA0148401.1 YeeE/YedE thiosulfate transporter family protein [Vibrio sp. LaRot3]
MSEYWMSLTGGMLLGVSATLLMLVSGKVAGISGILRGTLLPVKGDVAWRWVFLIAMVIGGVFVSWLVDFNLPAELSSNRGMVVVAGLLVGVGTSLANGCTSGHGICGIGRLSGRSIVATVTFMAMAILTVWIAK